MPDRRPSAYDVAIAGGGPAGAATALALKRRDASLRVALVEKTDYAARRVGETLPPPAQRLLRDLGVWDAFLQRSPLESSGSRAAWGSAAFQENEFIYSTYGRGWHVDRRDFDGFLAGEAERRGVDVFRNTTYDAADVAARFVVDATGRRSLIARRRGARHLVLDRLVGSSVFLRVDASGDPPDSYTSIEACEYGWWYTATLPGGAMAAILMTDAHLLRRLPWRTVEQWVRLSAVAPYTAARIRNAVPVTGPAVHPAASQRLDRFAGNGWLAVGDAACAFDPLSSQGVVKALRGAITASLAICQHLAGQPQALAAYEARMTQEFDHYLEQRRAYYALEQRWPESPFWHRRHAHAVHVEDQHQEEPDAAGAGAL